MCRVSESRHILVVPVRIGHRDTGQGALTGPDLGVFPSRSGHEEGLSRERGSGSVSPRMGVGVGRRKEGPEGRRPESLSLCGRYHVVTNLDEFWKVLRDHGSPMSSITRMNSQERLDWERVVRSVCRGCEWTVNLRN